MKLKTINYCAENIESNSAELKELQKKLLDKNIIYLFFNCNECLYIGETGKSLKDRCYVHTPKEKDEKWFKEGNIIHIIQLDEKIDTIARQTIEAVLIMAYRPKYNKKG